MDREEVKQILTIINVAYPNFYKDSDKKAAVNLWCMMFEEDSLQSVQLAVKTHIATNKFPPKIADIRESLVNVSRSVLSSDEAWGMVKKAISRYGMYRETEAIESLSDELGTFVKRFGYKDLCLSENIMADRAHFIKLWESNRKNEKYNAMIPLGITQEIDEKREQLTNISDLIQLPDKFNNYEQRTGVDYEALANKAMQDRVKGNS